MLVFLVPRLLYAWGYDLVNGCTHLQRERRPAERRSGATSARVWPTGASVDPIATIRDLHRPCRDSAAPSSPCGARGFTHSGAAASRQRHVLKKVLQQSTGPWRGGLWRAEQPGRAAGRRAAVAHHGGAAQGLPHLHGRHGRPENQQVRSRRAPAAAMGWRSPASDTRPTGRAPALPHPTG